MKLKRFFGTGLSHVAGHTGAHTAQRLLGRGSLLLAPGAALRENLRCVVRVQAHHLVPAPDAENIPAGGNSHTKRAASQDQF